MPSLFLTLCFGCGLLVPAMANRNYSSLEELWPDMVGLSPLPRQGSRNPHLGGLDFGKCCRLALNESVTIVNGNLAFRPGQSFLHGDPAMFASLSSSPCALPTYTGYEASVQQGVITYSWCATHCPGWAMNAPNQYNGWVFCICSFILPAIIFCLNVPRRMHIAIPKRLITTMDLSGCLWLLLKAPLALAIACVDVLVWMSLVSAFAGPMILSCFQEAMIDYRLLRILGSDKRKGALTPRQRAQLALIILLGKLDIDPGWDELETFFDDFPERTLNPRHAKGTLKDVRIIVKSLLASQPSFGVVLGIAVLFFLGTFVYSSIEIQDTLGDSYTAHALATGIFFMVIPHVAIVCSFLLAGGNSALIWRARAEASARPVGLRQPSEHSAPLRWGSITSGFEKAAMSKPSFRIFSYLEESGPHQAWLWDRGPCKRAWLQRFQDANPGVEDLLSGVLRTGPIFWALLYLPAFLLVFIPAFLGAAIAYTTPVVGLSCKSLPCVLFVFVQMTLMSMWICQVERIGPERTHSKAYLAIKIFVVVLCVIIAYVATIIVPALKLMGVMNNCFCYIPIQYWPSRWTNPKATLFLATDTRETSHYAALYWLRAAIASSAFLLFMCFTGWWSQRVLRSQFLRIVDGLMDSEEEFGKTTSQSHNSSAPT